MARAKAARKSTGQLDSVVGKGQGSTGQLDSAIGHGPAADYTQWQQQRRVNLAAQIDRQKKQKEQDNENRRQQMKQDALRKSLELKQNQQNSSIPSPKVVTPKDLTSGKLKQDQATRTQNNANRGGKLDQFLKPLGDAVTGTVRQVKDIAGIVPGAAKTIPASITHNPVALKNAQAQADKGVQATVDFARFLPRAVAQVGESVPIPGVNKHPSQVELTPKNKLVKALLGDQPVPSLQKSYKETKQTSGTPTAAGTTLAAAIGDALALKGGHDSAIRAKEGIPGTAGKVKAAVGADKATNELVKNAATQEALQTPGRMKLGQDKPSAAEPLMAEKTKLEQLKAENPHVPQLDKTIGAVDKKIAEVQKGEQQQAKIEEKATVTAHKAASKGFTDEITPEALALHTQASLDHMTFQPAMKQLADQMGHDYVEGAPKTAEKIAFKTEHENGGDIGKIKDAVRGTMVVDDPAKIPATIEALKQQYPIVRVKDTTKEPGGLNGSGYKDVKVNVKLPNGSIGEMILISPEMQVARQALGGHNMYDAITQKQGDYIKTKNTMRELYSAAEAASVKRLSSGETGTPRSKALTGGKGAPVAKTEPETVSPSPSTLTKVPSTSKNSTPGTPGSSKDIAAPSKPIIPDKPKGVKSVSEDVAKDTTKNGGTTSNLKGQKPTEGYAYAPNKDTELAIPLKEFSEHHVAQYMLDHAAELTKPGNHIGTWVDDGKVYLDVSRVGEPSAKTIQEAQDAKQLAVFDLKHFKEVTTGKIDEKGVYSKVDEAANIHDQHQREVAPAGSTGNNEGRAASPEKPEEAASAKPEKPKPPRLKLDKPEHYTTTTPEIKDSRLAQSTNAKAIDAKLTKGFEGLPEYAKVNVKDQAEAAANLLKTDFEKARSIALGRELPPEGLLPESVYVAIEDHALKNADAGLLKELATSSSLSAEATGMGQRIRMLAEREPDSAVQKIRELSEARRKAAEKKLKQPVEKVIKKTTREIKAKVTSPTRMEWSKFVEEIKCKV